MKRFLLVASLFLLAQAAPAQTIPMWSNYAPQFVQHGGPGCAAATLTEILLNYKYQHLLGKGYLPDPYDWAACGLYAASGAPYIASLKTAAAQSTDGFEQALAVCKEARARRVEALAAGQTVDAESHASLFVQALQLFQEYVVNHPRTPQAARALRHVETCLFELGKPEAARDYFMLLAENAQLATLKRHSPPARPSRNSAQTFPRSRDAKASPPTPFA